MINQNLLLSADDAYTLTKSLRFRSSASANLSRTPASAGNRKTWTYSAWVKRGKVDSDLYFLFAANPSFGIRYENNALLINLRGDATNYFIDFINVYRDPSAWYHLVFACDTTQATSTNRFKVYVNGIQLTTNGSYSSYPPQNYDTGCNTTSAHYISRNGFSDSYWFDGYMDEVNFIDGQQLTPSSFGSTNATTGVWQPAKYTGTYGTNGFYLPFTDVATTSGSNAGLGKDFSGNGNYWTTNNISVTAGTTYDSMNDVPTLTSATTANYCVMNPLDKRSIVTVSSGNLNIVSDTSGSWGQVRGTMAFPTLGKFYWEVTLSTTSTEDLSVGIGNDTTSLSLNFAPSSWANYYGVLDNGDLYSNNSSTSGYGSSFANGDVFMVAFDRDNNKIYFGKNGTWFNSSNPATQTNPAASSISTSLTFFPMTGSSGFVPPSGLHNFGQQGFKYTPPTGFVALNTFNLPTSTIVKGNTVMDATTYTGTLLSNAITNTAGFKPDLVWIKSRSAATDNKLTDSVRGTTKGLISNTTGAETTDTQGLTAFGTGGFTVGTNTDYNNLTATYVGWQWQAGQGSSSSNTSGSITSTVSVNATAGFSVVTYTGTGANATVGHGLGVAPSMIIAKSRSGTADWDVYHSSLGATQAIYLNRNSVAATSSAFWNNTAPTSSVFSLGTGTDINASGATNVAYCWAEIAGFSKFGSYTGNGSADGPFVYTGFQPKWLMIKVTNTTDNWYVIDTVRQTYNVIGPTLAANLNNAEFTLTVADVLSNGFKIRNSASVLNGNGNTVIYMAFACNPFKNSNAF